MGLREDEIEKALRALLEGASLLPSALASAAWAALALERGERSPRLAVSGEVPIELAARISELTGKLLRVQGELRVSEALRAVAVGALNVAGHGVPYAQYEEIAVGKEAAEQAASWALDRALKSESNAWEIAQDMHLGVIESLQTERDTALACIQRAEVERLRERAERAERDRDEWALVAQHVCDADPMKPKATPALLHAVTDGLRAANVSMREEVARLSVYGPFLDGVKLVARAERAERALDQVERERTHWLALVSEAQALHPHDPRSPAQMIRALKSERDEAQRAFDEHQCETIAGGALDAQAAAEIRMFAARAEVVKLEAQIRALEIERDALRRTNERQALALEGIPSQCDCDGCKACEYPTANGFARGEACDRDAVLGRKECRACIRAGGRSKP